MLPLLPQGQAPVPNADQHILKEGGALQADDGPIVGPHTCLAVVWVLLSLCVYASVQTPRTRLCHYSNPEKLQATGQHSQP